MASGVGALVTSRRATPPHAKPRTRAHPKRRPTAARFRLPPSSLLAEPPHGHIVCRRCGRIHPLDLQPTDNEFLVALSSRGPRGWTVERIAYSLAAVCPSCAASAPK